MYFNLHTHVAVRTCIILPNSARLRSEYTERKLFNVLDSSSFRPEQNMSMPTSKPVPKSHSSTAMLAYVITGCNSDRTLSFSPSDFASSNLVNNFLIFAVEIKILALVRSSHFGPISARLAKHLTWCEPG